MHKCEKRLTTNANETYYTRKRDLLIYNTIPEALVSVIGDLLNSKRDPKFMANQYLRYAEVSEVSEETYAHGKGGLCTSQNRPINLLVHLRYALPYSTDRRVRGLSRESGRGSGVVVQSCMV